MKTVFENDLVKISRTGRDYDFVGKIENKSDREIRKFKNTILRGGFVMKKTTYTTTRFDIDGEFYVEVSPDTDLLGREMFEFVLCKRNYGIKSFMVGLYKRDCPEDTWEEIIMENIKDYIESFLEDMDCLESR